MAPMRFVGVDGCPYGWFSVAFDENGEYELKVCKTFDQLLEHYKDAELILVDIPIGLPEGPDERECDPAARDLLKPRGSTVFRTPTRHTVEFVTENPKDYGGANRTERRYAKNSKTGKCVGISKQAFHIIRKIDEVDKVLSDPGRGQKSQVREVHPELCFWALTGGQVIKSKKKVKQGRDKRRHILENIQSGANEVYREARSEFRLKDVARDDILDALVAAVTAYKGTTQGRLEVLPYDHPPKDSKGLPMEMVYWIPG